MNRFFTSLPVPPFSFGDWRPVSRFNFFIDYTNRVITKCKICGYPANTNLCLIHNKIYVWDKSINGFRLKKRTAGSRYTQAEYHKNEIKLTKILEKLYGKKNIITSYHPIWALSKKKVLYEFDIYIKTKDVLIEYNGIQHYQYVSFFHQTKTKFLEQKKRDKIKNKLVKKNGKKLIVFKYNEPIFKDYIINKIEGEINGINNT